MAIMMIIGFAAGIVVWGCLPGGLLGDCGLLRKNRRLFECHGRWHGKVWQGKVLYARVLGTDRWGVALRRLS